MTKRRKRGQNEGSIYQRQDGRWVAVLNLGWKDGKRDRRYLYGATRAEAAAKLTAALADRQRGLPTPGVTLTVGAFLDRWLADDVAPARQPGTYQQYATNVRLHLAPSLGRYPLTKLGPEHVQAMMRAKLAAGLSPRTVQGIRGTLRTALNRAMKWGLVARNVAALVDPPAGARVERDAMTPEQARQLLDAAKGDRFEALYAVAIALGLRQGEALGLRWQDIDLDARTLRVQVALQRVKGKGLILKEPKTRASRRTIDLPASSVAALRTHRARQLQDRLLAGSRWHDTGMVFTTLKGTPMDASEIRERFYKLLDRAGLPHQRFHDLRHCCASLLLAQRVPARVVMEILGHSQISTTMDLYSHVMPAARREAADLMDRILEGAG